MAELEKKDVDSSTEIPTPPGVIVSPGNSSPTSIETSTASALPPAVIETDISTVPISDPTTLISDSNGISWTASEFVAHEKSAGWYLTLAITAIAISVIIYLLTKDKISALVVLIGALILGIYGARKPRQLGYRLDDNGITIGSRHHNYEDFRSFAVLPEGAFSSIVFMPLKRFATFTTIYYAPEDEEKIIKLLSDRLPFEERSHDAVDRLMRRIRF